MPKSVDEIKTELKDKLGDKVEELELKWPNHIGYKLLNPRDIVEAAKAYKKAGFSQALLITAIDWPKENEIELVYKFNRMDSPIMGWIRTRISREDAKIPSIVNVFKSAFPHELEQYDLMGVKFEGNPDLRRIFLPHDWNLGFPLRKDFKIDPDNDYPWWERAMDYFNPYKEVIEGDEDDVYYISVGPQHPALHGTWRVFLKVKGDTILEAWPDFGFVHRGLEKLAEGLTYEQFVVLSDRICYASSMTWNLTQALAIEDLLGIEPPDRAQWLRMILAEMQRIVSHLTWLGASLGDIGTFHAMFVWAIRDREPFLDLFETISGARLTYSFIRIGGVGIFKHAQDIPQGWIEKLKDTIKYMKNKIKEYIDMTLNNDTFYMRMRNVGIIGGKAAIEAGATGPVLRGAGIPYDVRKIAPYLHYDEVDFEVPTGKKGDVYDRWMVRLREIQESIRIIEQAIELMPKTGPLRVKVPPAKLRGRGEGMARTEDPRGEAIIYVVGNGTNKPYRMRIRSPTYVNLMLTHYALRNQRFADIATILGSFDPCMAEVDR